MKLPRVACVGVVAFNAEKVVLVRHGKTAHHYEGVIGLPSGKIDPGETAIQTAKRELEEETGLKCSLEDLVPLPKDYQATIEQKDGTKIFDWQVFLCKKYSGSLRATDETEPFWKSTKELSTLELLPNVADAVDQASQL